MFHPLYYFQLVSTRLGLPHIVVIIISGTVSSGKDQEEEDEDSDVEDLAEADEDESDLDLAWKMLDVARAIVEKHSVETMEKVDILSALAEVALERGLSRVIFFFPLFFNSFFMSINISIS